MTFSILQNLRAKRHLFHVVQLGDSTHEPVKKYVGGNIDLARREFYKLSNAILQETRGVNEQGEFIPACGVIRVETLCIRHHGKEMPL